VWLAHRADGTMHRDVALKLPHVAWSPALNAGWRASARSWERLTHPNIARLYDAGLTSKGGHSWRWNYGHGGFETFRKQIAGLQGDSGGTKKA